MTDKEFKRLSRAQLIEIIYQLQLQIDELTERNKSLEKELTDKRLRIDRRRLPRPCFSYCSSICL